MSCKSTHYDYSNKFVILYLYDLLFFPLFLTLKIDLMVDNWHFICFGGCFFLILHIKWQSTYQMATNISNGNQHIKWQPTYSIF